VWDLEGWAATVSILTQLLISSSHCTFKVSLPSRDI
jgi:hypothetical protein